MKLEPTPRPDREQIHSRAYRRRRWMAHTGWSKDKVIIMEGVLFRQVRCPICRRKVQLVLDHCHTTLTFRGFICQSCNKGRGLFGDNPKTLKRARKYLMNHQKKVNLPP